jgi:hypothetical protein
MAAWFEDPADIFLAGQEVTTDPVIDLGRKLPAWDLVENIIAELSIDSAAAGASDSLVVTLQYSHDQASWAGQGGTAVVLSPHRGRVWTRRSTWGCGCVHS